MIIYGYKKDDSLGVWLKVFICDFETRVVEGGTGFWFRQLWICTLRNESVTALKNKTFPIDSLATDDLSET
jgi:hypothetical protein